MTTKLTPVVRVKLNQYCLICTLVERNRSERNASKSIIESARAHQQKEQVDRVNKLRSESQAKRTATALSVKHAQKFAEYYLKLGKEVTSTNFLLKPEGLT